MTSDSPRPIDRLTQFTQLMEQTEDSLGTRLNDRPSSQEMWSAIEVLKTATEAQDDFTPSQVHATIELLRKVSDKWVDQGDPIGKPARLILEELIHRLGVTLDNAVPEARESRQRYEDLRAAQYLIKRKMHREDKEPRSHKETLAATHGQLKRQSVFDVLLVQNFLTVAPGQPYPCGDPSRGAGK